MNRVNFEQGVPAPEPRSRRHGFTLVELLVVIAIIGVLVGLLLPAVQSAREAARQSACSNKIKQIGLAALNYESVQQKFPPAGEGYSFCPSAAGGAGSTQIYDSNGMIKLLPFLEQQQLYDNFNKAEAISKTTSSLRNLNGTVVGNPDTNGNAALAGTVLGEFTCPSDTNTTNRLTGSNYGATNTKNGAATDYDFVTSSGDFGTCNNWKTQAKTSRRMFGENSTTRIKDVTDGLNNTFMVGETTKYHVNGAGFGWAYRAWVMVGIDPGTSNPGINMWHLPTVDPTWQNPPYIPVAGRIRTWWSPAGSLHPNGCFFVMGDGSVQFIAENIGSTLLGQLCTMAGGESSRLP